MFLKQNRKFFPITFKDKVPHIHVHVKVKLDVSERHESTRMSPL
jgi:hypothetical protein